MLPDYPAGESPPLQGDGEREENTDDDKPREKE
jgi:hypothetical protein